LILLTPYDTFFLWRRWGRHPYNRRNGGPCARRPQLLLCASTRAAMKARLTFAVERWGASGALFAWDLFNEIHPAQAEGRAEPLGDFIADLGAHVRALETRLYGRAHPQTVSMFWPEIINRPALDLATPTFRHPALDFASAHLYEHGTIDHPRNTVDAAVSTGRIVRRALAEIVDGRPFLDSEHGPIHTFKDHHRTLPAAFDDEYFRHMQWAHVASGGAGGGMRWPNRHPHTLTPGMRAAQRALSGFLPLIDWARFRRRNLNDEVAVEGGAFATFACADDRQAVVWLLRTDTVARGGMLRRDAPPARARAAVPALRAGRYGVTVRDTVAGATLSSWEVEHRGGALGVEVDVVADAAVAIAPR